MATSLTLRNDPTLQQGYVDINGTTSATFTTTGITGNLTGNVTGNADTATKLSTTTGSAPAYACRAWVNFDGTRDTTGAVSTANTNRFIRSSGNVTSVLRNAAGDYTITFTTPMSDANYSVSISASGTAGAYARPYDDGTARTVTLFRMASSTTTSSTFLDNSVINAQVFGN